MVDVRSPRQPLSVNLSGELIEELYLLAGEKQVAVDDLVMEACLAYTEPYIWERCYQERLRTHPDEPRHEFGIDGDDLNPPQSEVKLG